MIQPSTLPGSLGGLPGGREAGSWVWENIPRGANLVIIRTSTANILQFYRHRKAYGPSSCPNPLRRNPSYKSLNNPDLQLRNGDLQYLVWDSFRADRSAFFAKKLLQFVRCFQGRIIRAESIMAHYKIELQLASQLLLFTRCIHVPPGED